MKRVLLVCLFMPLFSYPKELGDAEKMASFCKMWGFLKYFHPIVNTTNIDWDSVFVASHDAVLLCKTSEDLNKRYTKLIDDLGVMRQDIQLPASFPASACSPNSLLYWVTDTQSYDAALTERLTNIVKYRAGTPRFVRLNPSNGMVEFINEHSVYDSMLPDRQNRMLTLARYWNAVAYFCPYINKMDERWDTTLTRLIPQFEQANDLPTYEQQLKKLMAGTNDCQSKITNNAMKGRVRYFLPFMVNMVQGRAVVVELLNDSFCRMIGINTGDLLLSVNDTNIQDYISHERPFISASNTSTLMRDVAIHYTSGFSPIANITFMHGNETHKRVATRYSVAQMRYEPGSKGPEYERIAPNIGFVRMGQLQPSSVKKAMHSLRDTKAIIFDLRAYPNDVIQELGLQLACTLVPFLKFATPDIASPGHFTCEQMMYIGKKKKRCYRGKVIVLVNEYTQSGGEYVAMVLQALPNTTLVGRTTAGAVGYVTKIPLPGGDTATMNSVGILFPDGREIQRVGIIPNILVPQTIEGTVAGTDEIKAAAIRYINGLK